VYAARHHAASVRPQLHESSYLRLYVGKVPHQSALRLPPLLLLLLLTMTILTPAGDMTLM